MVYKIGKKMKNVELHLFHVLNIYLVCSIFGAFTYFKDYSKNLTLSRAWILVGKN